MNEIEFLEIVESVCRRPGLYTSAKTFLEAASFLEGLGNAYNVGENSHHMSLTPFRNWLARRLTISSRYPGSIDWVDFRDHFGSDEEAFKNLSILFSEYTAINGAN